MDQAMRSDDSSLHPLAAPERERLANVRPRGWRNPQPATTWSSAAAVPRGWSQHTPLPGWAVMRRRVGGSQRKAQLVESVLNGVPFGSGKRDAPVPI